MQTLVKEPWGHRVPEGQCGMSEEAGGIMGNTGRPDLGRH